MFPSPPWQFDYSRVRHASSLCSSQHLPDSPERDAQLPGQKLEWENERTQRPTDQQQFRKDTAPENSRIPEQRREIRKDWVAHTHLVPVPWSAAFRSVYMCVCVRECVCAPSYWIYQFRRIFFETYLLLFICLMPKCNINWSVTNKTFGCLGENNASCDRTRRSFTMETVVTHLQLLFVYSFWKQDASIIILQDRDVNGQFNKSITHTKLGFEAVWSEANIITV